MSARRKLSAATAATVAATLLASAASAGAAALPHAAAGRHPAGAVFVQTDNPAGNAISVYDRATGGTLSPAGTYPTGGLGGVLGGSVVDHLASQNSLVYDAGARELFAVNAGSDTVSVFGVHAGDRLRLRQVIGSGGSFPVSIAVDGEVVYVLNALGGGTIQGYRLIGGRLAAIAGSSRTLSLTPDPASVFTTTPGDIAFTPGGQQLLVTTKGSTNAIDVFAVDSQGLPSATPVVNAEPGAVPFAFAFSASGQVDVAEPGPDAVASFSLSAGGTLTPIASVQTGAAGTCWLVADGSVLFAGNAGSATETSVLSAPSGQLTLGTTTATDPGTVDAAASPDGRYLYVQTGRAGIVDEFQVGTGGTLAELGSVTVPNAAGGEGIATS